MPDNRRNAIRDMLSEKPFVSLRELESRFSDVTSMTLRRDIDFLEKKGDLIKVRGGARSMKFLTTSAEDDFGKRLLENPEEKSRIAEKAAEFIETGRSLFLDSGTTALRLASIVRDERFTITTTGPHVAIELAKNQKAIVNLVGGMINRENFSVSGMQAIKFIDDVNIDLAFIVPSGCSIENWFTCGNYSECELKKYVIQKARRVIMMMDSSKLDRSLPYTFCVPADIDIIVTDAPLPADIDRKLREAGTEIIVAD